MTNSYIPEEFEITYKHDLNGTRSIKLVGNSLLVNNPNPEFIDIEQISKEKWIQFWEDVDDDLDRNQVFYVVPYGDISMYTDRRPSVMNTKEELVAFIYG